MPAKPTRDRGAMIERVLTAAARSGDIDASINKYGQGLSHADAQVIKKLTPEELKHVGSLRKKLGPLGHAAADNNGGVF